MAAKDLPDTEQPELPLSRKPQKVDVSLDLVARQPSFTAALGFAIQVSGLDDKEIYLQLGINAGHWSRIRKGEANFPQELYAQFCELVGNDIIVQWIAYQRGYGIVMLKSEAERRAELAEKRAEEAESRVKWLTDLLQGKAVK